MRLIIAKSLTIQEALDILGIDQGTLSDPAAVKKAYKKQSMLNHPDKGGSVEQMQLINQAYETLKDKKGGLLSPKFDWEKLHKEYRELAAVIKKDLVSKFDPKAYEKYFESIAGQPFTAEITSVFPKDNVRDPSYAGFAVNISNDDKTIVFTLRADSYLVNIKNSTGLGTGSISYPLGVHAFGYANRRKQTLMQRDYKHDNDHAFLKKPEMLFPAAKVKKMLGNKRTTFKRRDMEIALVKELRAKLSDKYAYVPVGEDDHKIVMFRSVFQRMPTWSFNGLYQGNKRISMLHSSFMPESPAVIDELKKLQKKLKGVSDTGKIEKEAARTAENMKKLNKD